MGKTSHKKNQSWRDGDEEVVPVWRDRKPAEDEDTPDWKYIRSSKDVEADPDSSEESPDKEKNQE